MQSAPGSCVFRVSPNIADTTVSEGIWERSDITKLRVRNGQQRLGHIVLAKTTGENTPATHDSVLY